MYADLHIHTTASDGTDHPRVVVKKALGLGLRAIAISDHDTLSGVIEAQQAAQGYNLEVLSGVEVNTYFQSNEIHVLGYLIDPKNDEFVTKLKEFQGERLDRTKKMVEKLKGLDIKIDLDRVLELSEGGSVGRPHLARAMLEKGYVATLQEAFATYIGAGKAAFVPREKLTPVEAVQLILRADGVPVLAHPGLVRLDPFLPELIQAGLKGIEVWHRNHTSLMVDHYYRLAQKYNLIPTGGSDYHGAGHDTCNTLGAAVAPYESVQLIKSAAGKH
ncbi:MAG: PHP domain-containing protein [Bacillota bacterium]